jgi:hypothetical protein
VPDTPAVAPVLSTEFAAPKSSPISYPTETNAPNVLPEFRHSDAGQRTNSSILRSVETANNITQRAERMQSEEILMRERTESHERRMAEMAVEIESNRLRLERMQRELEVSVARQEAEIRHANRQTEMLKLVFAVPLSSAIATRSLPELGLKEGDLLHFIGPSATGMAKVVKTDESLDQRVYSIRQGKLTTPQDNTHEPLEILFECLRDGRLRRLSDSELNAFLKEKSAQLLGGLRFHDKLLIAFSFSTNEALQEIGVLKGDRLRFSRMTANGVIVTVNDIERSSAVPLQTLMQWIEEKKLVELDSFPRLTRSHGGL